MKFSSFLKKLRNRGKPEEGFTLVELVVTVSIMLVLTIGGVVNYQTLTESTQQAAYESAVEETFIAAIVYEADRDDKTDWRTAANQFNYSATGDFGVWGTENASTGEIRLTVYQRNPDTGAMTSSMVMKGSSPAVEPKTLWANND